MAWPIRASMLWPSSTFPALIFYHSALRSFYPGYQSLLVILSHTNINFAPDLHPGRPSSPDIYLYGQILSLHSSVQMPAYLRGIL